MSKTLILALAVAIALSVAGVAVATQFSPWTTAQKTDEVSGNRSKPNTKRYPLADDPRFAISRQTVPTAKP